MLQTFGLNIELNLFTLLLVGILLAASSRKQTLVFLSARLFFNLLALNGIMILLETARTLVSGTALPGGSAAGIAVNTAYFAIEGALFLRYFTFIDFHVFGDTLRTRRLAQKTFMIWFVYLIPIIISVFTGWIFSVSPKNELVRGPAFAFIPVFSYTVVGAGLFRAFHARGRIEKRSFWPLFLFPLPTLAGGTVQLLNPATPFLWAGASLSMLIVFLHIQNERLNRDYLTGAWNRRFLDEYLEHQTQFAEKEPELSGIFIDLDGFKKLNDTFGHETGDQALQMTASILKTCIYGGDFLARYAGDEFVIILETSSPGTLTRVISRIEDEIDRFNRGKSRPYEISLSIGSAIFNRQTDKSGSCFLKRMDAQMYETKQERKRLRAEAEAANAAVGEHVQESEKTAAPRA